jgi:Signal transduction histidine kinase
LHPSAYPECFSPWQGITEPIPVGLCLLLSEPEAPQRLLYVSPSCLALVNVELEALQADPALALQALHPDDRDTFKQHSAARVAAGEPVHWKGRLLVNDRVSWVRIDARPTPQADGSLLWECLLSKFSDNKQRDQELRQRLQDLHRSLDHLPIPVVIGRNEPDPAVLLVNRCFSETFGYDLGCIESLTGWLEKACPDPRRRRFSLARWQTDLAAARRGSGRIPARRDRLICGDGSRRDVWIRAVVIDDLLLATFLDVTESRRAELVQALARRRQGRQQREELDRKLQSSLTAAAMVHEIQQPLSTLLIGAQLALTSLEETPGPASPQLRSLLATQLDQARQLQQTAETMRALLRNVQTPHLPVNLNEVVESALLFLRRTLLDSGIRVDLQAVSPSCWVAGDGPQLQIAVINLLSNAQHALSAAAATQPRIVVALRRTGEDLELAVEDNGPGLPPELIAGGVVTSAESRRMGLGLYVVRTTMENHGGTLGLGRSPLGGAAVTLRFPTPPTSPQAASPP